MMKMWPRHQPSTPDVTSLLDRRLEELCQAVRELEEFAEVFHDHGDGEADDGNR